MAVTHTYTLATLHVSIETYEEIETTLREAGYNHAFVDGGINMTGIKLVTIERAADLSKRERKGGG